MADRTNNSTITLHLKETMLRLPYITADLPGVGGAIKAEPAHFRVEEILPYTPCGQGEHVYVTLRRQGWNTADVARALGRAFRLRGIDVGWGGRKDKNAVTTQTFSLRLPMTMPPMEIQTALKPLPFEILQVKRHGNKIKTGHVAANRFKIILSQTPPGALGQARAIAEALGQRGVANYYGEQRFGRQMRNLDRAMSLVKSKRPAKGKKNSFIISALQSALFNLWLQERIERNQFNQIILGDIARKTDTGGLFIVNDVEEASRRFADRRIAYTGPMYGHKMMSARHLAGDYETHLLQACELTRQDFKPLRAPGSRRTAMFFMDDLTIGTAAEGLEFNFTLPAGAYATSVLREFMREDLKPI